MMPMRMLAWSLLFLLPDTCNSFTSPHPNAPDYDSLAAHHRELRKRAPFRSPYINPALCHNLSHNQCKRMEQDFLDHGRQLRRLAQVEGFLRILVVPIIFSDHDWRWFPDISVYEEIFNGNGIGEHTPTGSMKEWFDVNSYGKVRIEAEIVNWTVTDNTELHYSFNQSGLIQDLRKAWYPAFDKLEAQGFNFSRYDLDNDGVIDNLILLHSGYPAEVGGVDCYNTAANYSYRIWAHATSSDDNWESERHGVRARSYAITSALRGRCHQRPSRISILIHEYIHTFGVPDLVDWAGDWIGKGVGNFDVMGNAHGRNSAQIHPAHLSPWTKFFLGWNHPVEITQDGTYELEASELSDKVYIIRKHFAWGEFLVIENRQPILWDALLWGGGLLIWHHDESQSLLRFRGYPGQPGWPSNNMHYGLSVAQADGKYDLERGINSGDDGDYWRDGMELGPGPIDLEASGFEGYPNTNAYMLGFIRQTGIRIHNVSASRETMTFEVSGVAEPDPTSEPSSFVTDAPSKAPISRLIPVITTTTPTVTATASPTRTTTGPTETATASPSQAMSSLPSQEPSSLPTNPITASPTEVATTAPSLFMSMTPSESKSDAPSMLPTVLTSSSPTTGPTTPLPSQSVSAFPSTTPPQILTSFPSQPTASHNEPSITPSVESTATKFISDSTTSPTQQTLMATESPTVATLPIPTKHPSTVVPEADPTSARVDIEEPSSVPSTVPSAMPLPPIPNDKLLLQGESILRPTIDPTPVIVEATPSSFLPVSSSSSDGARTRISFSWLLVVAIVKLFL